MILSGNRIDVAVFQESKAGKHLCGDSYYFHEAEEECICAIADGLGSGILARDSSQAVIDAIQQYRHKSIEAIMKHCSQVLVNRRGAVLGIMKIDFKTKVVTFTSVGNIGIVIYSRDGKKTRHIPSPGYLSGYRRSFQLSRRKIDIPSTIFMFSDGVKNEQQFDHLSRLPSSGEIVDWFSSSQYEKPEDDTTLLVMKYIST